MRLKSFICAFTIILVLVNTAPFAAATSPSIPVNGRYSTLTVKIYIPAYPKWAHDVVLNAMIAWNRAQQLFRSEKYSSSPFYTFVETDDGSETSVVSYSMPTVFAPVAVGWTSYEFAVSSKSIIGTRTYLTQTIFSANQEDNVTAKHYAFWLALHELGRVLGLGSIIDAQDIMDPMASSQRVTEVPALSTLDLYALHVLAAGLTPAFVTLPAEFVYQLMPITTFLP